jgi:hypothetical protein
MLCGNRSMLRSFSRRPPYHASASVGAAVYPGDGLTQIQLHAVAEERMYTGKEQYHIEAARYGKLVNDPNRT